MITGVAGRLGTASSNMRVLPMPRPPSTTMTAGRPRPRHNGIVDVAVPSDKWPRRRCRKPTSRPEGVET